MIKRIQGILWIIASSTLIAGCISMGNDKEEIPPITAETDIKDVVNIGINYQESYDLAKSEIKKRQAKPVVSGYTSQLITEKDFTSQRMWRLINLYQWSTPGLVSPKIVDYLIRHKDSFTRQLGWLLAANRPSDIIAVTIERYISQAIYNNNEENILYPEMAMAAKENNLTGVYSILVNGLMTKGSSEFADAMIALNPQKAKYDTINYLAQATVEDLRQMNQKTVDMHTCIKILTFLNEYGVPLEHPRFEHLFLYAVSRNPAFAELASSVLKNYIKSSRDHLAYTLARLPVWIQVAFVESTREKMNANIGLFLSELKQVTAHQEVIEEINSIKR